MNLQIVNATALQEEIFDAARRLTDPVERKVFLGEACAGDSGLRTHVEELLAAQADAERFFAEGISALKFPAPDSPSSAGASNAMGKVRRNFPVEEQLGIRIGRYKLLQKIGEGGCGAVYMAEQEEPVRRRVALKIIKLGMDTKRVIARFEAERQALAMMDHPNIARVFDAGATDTGRPYFVMELVRGVKITDYCDQNHLNTNQRLDLFIRVCHAIQHAHQKGIIHRDIKPSNVMVTMHDGVPVPKVIDFGIAKATEERLSDKTLFTAYEQIIGTPAYMSPEQAEMSGLDVDTRSDIYSLGVLLYELLTGKTPFDSKELLQSGLDQMRRTLREREPHRPSTKITTLQDEELTATAVHRQVEPRKLISLVRGDLDWIVMKALEKDRKRRYETANGLAMDIRRHLSNEPVIARPPSRLYRFHKLVRRNKVVFAAAAAVSAALVIGLGMSTWLFLREREAHQRAVAAERQQIRLREEAEQARITEAELRRQAEAREKITQAAVFVSQGRFDEADELVDGVSFVQPSLESAAVFRSLGEQHALQGRWKQAVDRFIVLLQVNQPESWDVASVDHLECGTTLIALEDTDRYEHFRRAAIARFTASSNPVAAERIVKVSILWPAEEKVMESLRPLAEVAAKLLGGNIEDTGSSIFQAAWGSVSLALMEYRRGNYSKAVKWCERCLAYPEYNAPRTATARVVLAMARHRLGQADAARSDLAQGREMIENKFKSGLDAGSGPVGFWFDWVFARTLLGEATKLVGGVAGDTAHTNAIK